MEVKVLKSIFWMYIILLLFIPLFSRGVSGNSKTNDSSFVIQVTDDLLTVKVEDILLKKVLMEIANQIPIKIVSFVPREEIIMVNFSRLPIEKGLKRLLRGFNYAFIYDPEEDKSNWSGIRKVIILSRKEESQNKMWESESITFTGETSLETLRKALNNKDPFIREDAVDALGALKDESSIELLTEVLLNDKDEDVRISAADSLGVIGSEVALDSLKEALKDEAVDVRISAAEALGNIGSGIAIDSLKEAMQDKDEEVRESAVEALGFIGGDRAIQALKAALSDENEDVRDTATEILEQINS